MKVGWDIIDWHLLLRLHRIQREHLMIMLMTLSLTVFVDLVTAVAIGLIAARMAHARQLEQLELDSVVSVPMLDQKFLLAQDERSGTDPYAARVGLVAFRGSYTVASSHKLVGVVSLDIKEHKVVIFDFSNATSFDDSAAVVIGLLMDVAREGRTEFIVMGLAGPVARTLHALDILEDVPEDRVVDTLDEARQAAYELLQPDPAPAS